MNCCHETQCIFGKLNFVGHYFPLSVPDCSITRAGRMFRTALLRFKRGAADEVTFEIIRRLGSWIRDLTAGAAGDWGFITCPASSEEIYQKRNEPLLSLLGNFIPELNILNHRIEYTGRKASKTQGSNLTVVESGIFHLRAPVNTRNLIIFDDLVVTGRTMSQFVSSAVSAVLSTAVTLSGFHPEVSLPVPPAVNNFMRRFAKNIQKLEEQRRIIWPSQ